MKRFLNRIARSLIAAADIVVRLTDDQSSQAPSPKRGGTNGSRDEQSLKDKDSPSTETTTQSQQHLIRAESSASTSLLEFPRNKGPADPSQSIAKADDDLNEPEASPQKAHTSFADANSLFESEFPLDTNCATGSAANELHAEESFFQSTDELNIGSTLPSSEPLLPIHAPAAPLVRENPQTIPVNDRSAGSQYLCFDISLSDLEEKFESTWEAHSHPPYGTTIQRESEPPDIPLYEKTIEEIERAQAPHEFDLDLADLEVGQLNRHDSPRISAAEKPSTSSTNIESGGNKDHKPSLEPKLSSFAQQGSIYGPNIQNTTSFHDAFDDYSGFHRIKLRPDGLEELKLRQSGALRWDTRWDPEDYIWALDGVGYFDNIWNVEGFFESMVDRVQDRRLESLYWHECQGD